MAVSETDCHLHSVTQSLSPVIYPYIFALEVILSLISEMCLHSSGGAPDSLCKPSRALLYISMLVSCVALVTLGVLTVSRC